VPRPAFHDRFYNVLDAFDDATCSTMTKLYAEYPEPGRLVSVNLRYRF
jgi:outer membrane receptor protein involved in Fe transport